MLKKPIIQVSSILFFAAVLLVQLNVASAYYSDLPIDAVLVLYDTDDNALLVYGTLDYVEGETLDFKFVVDRLEADGNYQSLATLYPDEVVIAEESCQNGVCTAAYGLRFDNISGVDQSEVYMGYAKVTHEDGETSFEAYGDDAGEDIQYVLGANPSPPCNPSGCTAGDAIIIEPTE